MLECAGLRSSNITQGFSGRCELNEVVGIVGPNHAGKSSLLRVLAGLDRPTAGRLILADLNTAIQSSAYIGPDIALLSVLNCWNNVILPAQYHQQRKVSGMKVDDKAEQLMHLLEVWHCKDALPAYLDPAEHLRVLIARSMMLNPGILFINDTAACMDVETATILNNTYKKLMENFDLSIMLVTQQLEFLQDIANQIWFLSEGVVNIYDSWKAFDHARPFRKESV